MPDPGDPMLQDAQRDHDFPSLVGRTYLNTAAEGIPPRAVGQALAEYFRDKQLGMAGRDRHFDQWRQARTSAAELLGLSSEEVAICSCSSEAYNLAAAALALREGEEVVINDLDFPAGTSPWLQPSSSATVKVWRSREGLLDVADLVDLLGPRTRLVVTSLVSFYNGFRIPLPEVVDTVRRHSEALLAVDVTQALGRIPLKLDGVDLIVSSTHKWILASHGGGLVGVPRDRAEQWCPPVGGWFNQIDAFGPERFEKAQTVPGAAGFMVGMPNFPAIYAIRAGLEYIAEITPAAIDAATRPLVHACRAGLAKLPVELLTPAADSSLAGILAFRHHESDKIAARLEAKNIHIMNQAGRMRVSLHGYNRMDDVEQLLRALSDVIGS